MNHGLNLLCRAWALEEVVHRAVDDQRPFSDEVNVGSALGVRRRFLANRG